MLTADNSTITITDTMQVEEEQAALYRTICGHFDDNIRNVIQVNHQEAFLAAEQGFLLVQELYYGLFNSTDSFVSDTAGDRLLDLVRFCLRRASKVENTDWPRWQNSLAGIWGCHSAAFSVPPINWMAERALNLVVDLEAVCRVFHHYHPSSPRLRAFAVKALNFVAEFSFESAMRAVLIESPRTEVQLWLSHDKLALGVMVLQIHNADPFVSGAALGALFDQKIQKAWLEQLIGATAQ